MPNYEKIISIEIRLVKYPPGKDNIVSHLINGINRHKHGDTQYVIFRTFGWFDYLIMVINPRMRCLFPYESEQNIKHDGNNKGDDYQSKEFDP